MGIVKFHGLNRHANQPNLSKRAQTNPDCYTGGFYTSPTNGATVNSLDPLEITWDNTCLNTTNADLYVLTPGSSASAPHIWPSIPFAPGKYTLQLQPKWWNDSATQSLQISIVPSGSPLAVNLLPAGPVITATYSPPASGAIPEIANLNSTTTAEPSKPKSPTPGGKAAAVIFTLIFVGLLIFAYFRYQRKKTSEQRQRFSQAIDKRMSTIATDWKSMSAAGANAAIRNSIAVNRESSAFAFGAIRPMSTAFATEADPADSDVAQMTQVRTGTGVGLRNPAAAAAIATERASRVSRVSFAADTHISRVSFADPRPSGESRRTRAFHTGHVPPVPTRTDVVSTALSIYPDSELEKSDMASDVKEKEEKKSTGSPTLSPRQTQGPLTLTSEDILARMEGRPPSLEKAETSTEMDDVLPALSMMRTGLESSFNFDTQQHVSPTDDYLFTPLPVSPPPAYAKPTTASSPEPPSSPFFGQQLSLGPSVMSPDEMMRAYAERKAAAATPPPSFNGSHSPKPKGRKLSLRASFGGKKERHVSMVDKVAISYPMPIATPSTAGGMAGVGASSVGGGLPMMTGGTYAIGEDEEDTASAYVGMAS